jgi:hypothetical protein
MIPEQDPPQGGSYLRDPKTGELVPAPANPQPAPQAPSLED